MSPRPARCPRGCGHWGRSTWCRRDGLSAFGAVTRHMIRDGYRWQLRWAPWTYSAMYWLFNRVAPARGVGALALAATGQRRLRRLVRREQPDVVVTTHPALTCVLGRMRLRRRLASRCARRSPISPTIACGRTAAPTCTW